MKLALYSKFFEEFSNENIEIIDTEKTKEENEWLVKILAKDEKFKHIHTSAM